jgi:hypothetical protein
MGSLIPEEQDNKTLARKNRIYKADRQTERVDGSGGVLRTLSNRRLVH